MWIFLSDPSPIIGYACHYLTHWLPFRKLDWCCYCYWCWWWEIVYSVTFRIQFLKVVKSFLWRCQLKNCWCCNCCWYIYNDAVFVCVSRKMITSSWEFPVTTWTTHNHPLQLRLSFDGSRLVFHGSISVFIGFQWFRLVLMVFHGSRLVFHGSRSVFMVLGRF